MQSKILKNTILILCIVCPGCLRINPNFVQAAKEHRDDTIKVNNSLISTMQEEMDKNISLESKEAYQEIINNLRTISHQSDVLYSYVWDTLTEDELASVLKSKWRVQ